MSKNLTKTHLQIIQTLLSEDIEKTKNSLDFNNIRIKNILREKLTPSKQKKLDDLLEWKNDMDKDLVKKSSTYIRVSELLNNTK
jgi:hypothetical protein